MPVCIMVTATYQPYQHVLMNINTTQAYDTCESLVCGSEPETLLS